MNPLKPFQTHFDWVELVALLVMSGAAGFNEIFGPWLNDFTKACVAFVALLTGVFYKWLTSPAKNFPTLQESKDKTG